MSKTWFKAQKLEGYGAELAPMQEEHVEPLVRASQDGELWNLWYTTVPHPDNTASYVTNALADRDAGLSMPYVVRESGTQKIIGSTRFCNAEPEHRRLEIGYTWYARSFQRTHVNTACKYLLLTEAFDQLGAIAVEFRTHWHNHRSRAAISRLGAKQDGVLRNHRVDDEGCFRDTVVFSIIDHEWPVVKKSLRHQLERS